MEKTEVLEIVKRVKANFKDFRAKDEDVVSEWLKRLKNYDFEDINAKLDDYLNWGEFAPRINQLTNNVKTIEDKKRKLVGTFKCKLCSRSYNSINESDLCYERDLSVNYIKKIASVFNINIADYFINIERATINQINRNYDAFILRVIDEQKKNPKLNEDTLKGLRAYYKNVILKGGLMKGNESNK